MIPFPVLQQIKCVVSDLDGTLLNAEHQISSQSKQVISELVNQDVHFVLATGRHYEDVRGLAQQLDVDLCLITSNGARMHNLAGEQLYFSSMPEHLVSQVLAISKSFAVHRNIYQNQHWWVEEPHESLLAIHHASGFNYSLTDFADLALDNVDKLYFNADHQVLLQLEQALLAELQGQLTITFTSPQYLEVMNLGVSKAYALQKILSHKSVSPTQVLAFGDGMNDIEMLNMAGHKVVMDNASDRVKTAVPDAIKGYAHHNDGVAQCLSLLLQQAR